MRVVWPIFTREVANPDTHLVQMSFGEGAELQGGDTWFHNPEQVVSQSATEKWHHVVSQSTTDQWYNNPQRSKRGVAIRNAHGLADPRVAGGYRIWETGLRTWFKGFKEL